MWRRRNVASVFDRLVAGHACVVVKHDRQVDRFRVAGGSDWHAVLRLTRWANSSPWAANQLRTSRA
jgi:hypothetical protein